MVTRFSKFRKRLIREENASQTSIDLLNENDVAEIPLINHIEYNVSGASESFACFDYNWMNETKPADLP